MKIIQILNESEIWPNSYFGVLKALDVWKFGKLEGTGAYVGGFGRGHSQLMRRQKIKTSLNPGDEIHYLYGGVWAVTEAGDSFQILVVPPSDKSPFEKNYGPNSTELTARKFHELVQQQVLLPIEKEDAISTKYPR